LSLDLRGKEASRGLPPLWSTFSPFDELDAAPGQGERPGTRRPDDPSPNDQNIRIDSHLDLDETF
jgi:hypothetical protein